MQWPACTLTKRYRLFCNCALGLPAYYLLPLPRIAPYYYPMKQDSASSVHFYPLGDSALVIQLGEQISPEVHQRVQAAVHWLEQQTEAWLIEWVPAFTTLTLYYDPWLASNEGRLLPYERVVQFVQAMLPHLAYSDIQDKRLIEVPVCYGGALGPDLAEVAQHTKLSEKEVIQLHSQPDYLVYMIGFAPGFPYLGGMNKALTAPRKQSPRARVPAGSVGIAGEQTGIYSIETPGGWQLIGRTPLSLFDVQRDSPSLLKAGDRFRFVPVTEAEYRAILNQKA